MRRIALSFILCLACLAPGLARADRHHTVRPGQTLSHVARRFGVSVYDLKAHNHLRSPNLQPGQVLRVPPKGRVYVRPGQTLSHVARDHRCTIAALARANRMRPSEPLRAGQALTLPGFAAPRHDRDWGEPSKPGQVTVLHDGTRTPVQLVDAEGRVSRRGLIKLSELMGEGTEKASRPHPRLALLLADISDHFGGRPLRIVSGFREAGGFTSENSRHVAGRAADIQVAGVHRRTLWEYCRRLKGAGCGYYPNSVFTHVDARRSRTQWVDWSRPGRRPRYGTLRGPTRSKQRRRRMPYPHVEGEIPLRVAVAEDAYVALTPEGEPEHEVEVVMVDDHEPDPAQDRDIAEGAPPAWVKLACLGPGPWVPLTAQRAPTR